MKFGVVVFPGSNCDHDAFHVLSSVLGQPTEWVWHQSTQVNHLDAIVLPGGFSYGDYLRTGALASHSPVLGAVKKFAERGGLVLGICNGFQILLEAGLLPGAMLRNRRLKFLCRFVHLRVETTDTPFTAACQAGQVLKMPIAHMDGNYFAGEATLRELERNHQIIFRYATPAGEVVDDAEANPNGALANIAGICNRERNVLGLMPHPDRSSEALMGSTDGLAIFQSLVQSLVAR
ncbi:MAG: phosphoribosylformylglycinamidine synthase subunit PurQ [Candidatus Acidiferrales bacterium]